MSALSAYTNNQTAGNVGASSWGMGTNMAGMSQDAMMQTAENVMYVHFCPSPGTTIDFTSLRYMQTLIAVNPNSMKDGKFAVTNVNNMTIPHDLRQALASASPSASSAAAAGSTTATPSGAAAAASAAPTSPPKNSAGTLVSSSLAVGVVAVVTTFFAL